MLELAVRLGSDVAFFLDGGTALLKGRGEMVIPLPPLPHIWVVLMVPPLPRLPGKTKQLYTSLKASHYTDGQITERLVEALRESIEFTPSLLFNAFENVVFDSFTGLREYWQKFVKVGAQEVYLAGSGPTVFTLVKDKTQAEDLYIRLQQQGLESYLTDTLITIDKVEWTAYN